MSAEDCAMPPNTDDRDSSKSPAGHSINEILGLSRDEEESSNSDSETNGESSDAASSPAKPQDPEDVQGGGPRAGIS